MAVGIHLGWAVEWLDFFFIFRMWSQSPLWSKSSNQALLSAFTEFLILLQRSLCITTFPWARATFLSWMKAKVFFLKSRINISVSRYSLYCQWRQILIFCAATVGKFVCLSDVPVPSEHFSNCLNHIVENHRLGIFIQINSSMRS